MPIYEYHCKQCGKSFEIFFKTSQPTDVKCPGCCTPDVKKLISIPGHVGVKSASGSGTTCCGREEKCESPPCSSGGGCKRE